MATMTTVRVFGKPITDGTCAQRALAAINNQNEGGKFDQVVQTTNESKKWAATVNVSITIGRIYNATGEEIKKFTAKDWEGKVVGTFPVCIKNGQWAAFLHVGTQGKGRQSSVGAVVYQIVDHADLMVAWNNPWKSAQGGKNSAYCEMRNPRGFGETCDWDAIKQNLLKSGTEMQVAMKGYETTVKIGPGGNAPHYTAIFRVKT